MGWKRWLAYIMGAVDNGDVALMALETRGQKVRTPSAVATDWANCSSIMIATLRKFFRLPRCVQR
jgi:hypothetical protein